MTEWIYGEQLAKSPPDVIQKLTKVRMAPFISSVTVQYLKARTSLRSVWSAF